MSCRPVSRTVLALTTHVTPSRLRRAAAIGRIGRDHRMHEAKMACITLTTRRERTLTTSQITMTTRLGRRCLQLLPSTCCGGSAPTADAIDTDDCSPALQVDFAGKTAVHPSSGWLPRHCTAVPAESGRPTRQETSSVWPMVDPPGVSKFGVFTRFTGYGVSTSLYQPQHVVIRA